MPLFMDFHKFESITIEDVKNAHMADLATQEKYGVKYHQFWVNEEAGSVFCLIEGPDPESCEAVHKHAHGNIACALVKVEPGFYELIMGKDHRVDPFGRVINLDGTHDPGYRNVMVVTLQAISSAKNHKDFHASKIFHDARKLVAQKVAEFDGRKVEWAVVDSVVSVFNSTANTVRCAQQVQKAFQSRQTTNQHPNGELTFRIGVSAGQPVTEKSDFFEEAIKLAIRLSHMGEGNQIILSSLVNDLYNREESYEDGASLIKAIRPNDEEFITSLFDITENKLADEHFTIDTLSRDIGVSRPQLYRKIVTLTGKSPNDLVRELRMNKAAALLKRKSLNISQVAMEVGYNNPSYFTKCFSEKFGCTPSEFVDVAGA